MEVRKWTSEQGCEKPSSDLYNEKDENVAFIMRRGGCSHFEKAKNVHRVGGKLTIVILETDQDPEDYIPVGPDDSKLSRVLLICV